MEYLVGCLIRFVKGPGRVLQYGRLIGGVKEGWLISSRRGVAGIAFLIRIEYDISTNGWYITIDVDVAVTTI